MQIQYWIFQASKYTYSLQMSIYFRNTARDLDIPNHQRGNLFLTFHTDVKKLRHIVTHI